MLQSWRPLEELQTRLCVDIQIHLLNEHFNKHWVIGQKNNILEMCTTYCWLIGQMNNLKKCSRLNMSFVFYQGARFCASCQGIELVGGQISSCCFPTKQEVNDQFSQQPKHWYPSCGCIIQRGTGSWYWTASGIHALFGVRGCIEFETKLLHLCSLLHMMKCRQLSFTSSIFKPALIWSSFSCFVRWCFLLLVHPQIKNVFCIVGEVGYAPFVICNKWDARNTNVVRHAELGQ